MAHNGRPVACSPAPTLPGAVEIDIPASLGGSSGSSTDADSPLVMHGQLRLLDKAGYEAGTDDGGGRVARAAWRVWGRARRAMARGAGEERVPYLALLGMRVVGGVPGGRLLVHPRTTAVLGGVAVVAPAVGAAVLERRLAEEHSFHYPVFMQIAVLGAAAVLTELATGSHGLFVRSAPVRTARLLPLAALYVASMALGHAARRDAAAYGTHQIVQAALPIVVVLLLLPGAPLLGGLCAGRARTALDSLRSPIVSRASLSLSRGLRSVRHELVGRSRAALGATGVRMRDLSSGSSSSSSSSASIHRPGGGHDGDTEAPRAGGRYVSGTSSACNLGGLAYGRDCRPATRSATDVAAVGREDDIPGSRRGRELVSALAVLVAVATWSPRQAMVSGEGAAHWAVPGTGVRVVRGAVNIALSAASTVCNAAVLVGIGSQLRRQPGSHSPTAFVRHFAPLCMLGALVVWPMLEQPVDVLAELDARRLAACAAVAVLGAVSLVARVAVLAAPVSDGPVGVAAFAQLKTLACLAVGWWAFEYAYTWRQLAAFAAACACALAWAACRLLAKCPDLPAALSPRIHRPPRIRKCSSAGVL